LKQTLAELSKFGPPPQAKGNAYESDPFVRIYSDICGAFAYVGDEVGLRRAISIGTDPRGDPYMEWTRRQTVNMLVRAGRDDDGISATNTATDLAERLNLLCVIAEASADAGRRPTSEKALVLARRIAPAVDREREEDAGGRRRLAAGLIAADQLDEAVQIARSLPVRPRAPVEARLAAAFAVAGDRTNALRHAELAVNSLAKTGWVEHRLDIREIGEYLARAGEQAPVAALVKVASGAKVAPKTRGELNDPQPIVIPPIPTWGQEFSIQCHTGLALGFAKAGNRASAQIHIKLAEDVIQQVDPGPVRIRWYDKIHIPVVEALYDRGSVADAITIANTFPQKDSRGESDTQNLKVTVGYAYLKAGDVERAWAVWREAPDPRWLVVQYLAESGRLRQLPQELAARTTPFERCLGCLFVAQWLGNDGTTRPTAPSSQKAATRTGSG
jgi:hypothetical protein